MNIYVNPPRHQWVSLCRRAEQDDTIIKERVRQIIERVENGGDVALRELAMEIDGVHLKSLEVSEREYIEAERHISKDLKIAIEQAVGNISAFHRAQLPQEIRIETMPGVLCIQKPVAINRVGIYIPGGTAPLFSTVLMLALPAHIAGCRDIVMCTPCNHEGNVADVVLYAARRCGVNRVIKIGGAQAIAAMAYGTDSIPRTDKIFGPGNRYVTMAKQLVGGRLVSIDMPAGPSEVMVMADSTSNIEFVAADMLSQAEHGRDSQAMLVCDSEDLARAVNDEVERQLLLLTRGHYVRESLEHSRAIVFDNREHMIEFANEYGAEHLIISLHNPWDIADRITAAGSIFIGNYSPESAGDYASGTNHTLPTSGWAHSCSGVNIDSFMHKITIQELTRQGLESLAGCIETMAKAEGLQAHVRAVSVRIDNNKSDE